MVGMRQGDQDALGRGLSNLGTALFGDPQSDMFLSQAQQAQAQRQATLAEMQQAQNMRRVQQGLGGLFDTYDPEAGMGHFQPGISKAMQLGMEPETLGEFLRLAANVGGGGADQFRQGITDPGDYLDAQRFDAEQEAAAAQQQALGNLLGPDVGAAFGAGGGDLPDFMQRTLATMGIQGVDAPTALGNVFNQHENLVLDDGTIVRADTLRPDQSQVLFDPADRFRQEFGMPTEGILQPGMQGREQEPPGPQHGQTGGTQPQQPGQTQPMPQPEAQGGIQQGTQVQLSDAERQVGIDESDVQEWQASRDQIQNAELVTEDGVVRARTPEGQELSMFGLLEHMSGPGNWVQRLMTRTLGHLSDDFVFETPAVAQSMARHMAAQMRPMYTVSNRPSQWELQDIQPIFADPNFWTNPVENAARLFYLRHNIQAGREEAVRTLTSGGLRGAERSEMSAAIRQADRLLEMIGEPREVKGAEATLDRMREVADVFAGGGREGMESFVSQASGIIQEQAQHMQGSPQQQGGDDLDSQIESLTPEERELLFGGQ